MKVLLCPISNSLGDISKTFSSYSTIKSKHMFMYSVFTYVLFQKIPYVSVIPNGMQAGKAIVFK